MPTQTTDIDHRRRIKRVMLHVDRHLDDCLQLAKLADVACYSTFHFIRAFARVMGETPQQYVFRKRMERAGFLLLRGGRRVTDIALEVGYETTSAFSKGFRHFAGMSPRRFRDTVSPAWMHRTNRPFHPVTGHRRYAAVGRKPQTLTLPPMTIVYCQNRGLVDGSFLEVGRAAFQRLTRTLIDHDLDRAVRAFMGIYPYRFFSLGDDQAVSYTGALVAGDQGLPPTVATLTLPGGRYAVFTHRGPYEFLMQTWNRAYLDRLPRSGAALRDAPPFEIYGGGDASTDAPSCRAWVMIPIH